MSNEQLIFSMIGFIITFTFGVFGIIKWGFSHLKQKIDYVLARFDSNTERVMDKFEIITDKMNENFKENSMVHEQIKLQVIELHGELYNHIKNNGHSRIKNA